MKKRGKEMNKGFVYFFAFMFLGFLLFATTGVYNNSITGAVIGNSLTNSLGLVFEVIGGILTPLIKFMGVNEGYLGLKLLLGITLYLILKALLSTIGGEGILSKLSNSLPIIISLAFIGLTPDSLMASIFGASSQIGSFVVFLFILIVGVFLYFTFKGLHKWESKGGFEEAIKFIIYFIILVIIGYIGDNLLKSSSGFSGEVLGLFTSIAVVYCIVSMIIHAYKGLTHATLSIGKHKLNREKEFGELSKKTTEQFKGEFDTEKGDIVNDVKGFIARENSILSKMNGDSATDQPLADRFINILKDENKFLRSVKGMKFFSFEIPARKKMIILSSIQELLRINNILMNNLKTTPFVIQKNIKRTLESLLTEKDNIAHRF